MNRIKKQLVRAVRLSAVEQRLETQAGTALVIALSVLYWAVMVRGLIVTFPG